MAPAAREPPLPSGSATVTCLMRRTRVSTGGDIETGRATPIAGAATDVLVVGAGLAGLTIARELARAGRAVSVVERSGAVGGLARTFRYGGFFFDVGPHRFHTEDAEVAGLLAGALEGELLEIPRASAVRAFGRYHAWPLRPSVLASLPPRLLLRCGLELLRRERLAGDSFEAEVVNRYGRTLYEEFFAPYTQRFLSLPPGEVHRDWARAGMDRAVIDRRYRADGLWALARSTFLRRSPDTRFLYPSAGIGTLAERLAAGVAAAGGRVLLGADVTSLEVAGDRIRAATAGGVRIEVGGVVWTGAITGAARLLGAPAGGLEFISTVLYNLELARPARIAQQQWVYFGGGEEFVRVSVPAAFSGAALPAGRGSLCVECTCREGDGRWLGAEERLGSVVDDLVRVGAIASGREVVAAHVERVPDSYPVYGLEYPDALRGCLEALRRYPNLLLAGRSGRFWYNNMDHSIAQGLRIARGLAACEALADVDVGEREFWRDPGRPPRGAPSSRASGR